jgi:hypothetical protein
MLYGADDNDFLDSGLNITDPNDDNQREDQLFGGDGDDIVVWAPSDNSNMRVPYEPEPGARVRLVAGEAPSSRDALGAGSCCGRGGGLDVIAIGRTLGRGFDRLLHPY